MKREAKQPFILGSMELSSDPAMQRVIDSQAKMAAMRREIDALRKDRDELLQEYTDARKARSVPRAPKSSEQVPRADRVRVSVGDVHGMMADKDAVAAFLRDTATLNPDEVVLGGDILECGGWLAKHQPIGFVATCDYSYQEDVKAANDFLDRLQKAAPRAAIHYIEGNHEDRVERWCVDTTMAHGRDAEFLRMAFSPYALLRLEERNIPYYRRTEIYGDGLPRGWIRLGKMHFTHSLTYSKNAARDAVGKTAGNVTYWCTHREDTASIVFPTVGLCKAFNPGCLCQMQPLWRHSDPTSWSQGYAVDIIAKSENFQRIHVPIWRGESLAGAMIERFKS
jgi:hypothetical protein